MSFVNPSYYDPYLDPNYVPPPPQGAAQPVPSEMYGGAAPPVQQAYGNPDYIATTYPASGAPVTTVQSVSTGATGQAETYTDPSMYYQPPAYAPPVVQPAPSGTNVPAGDYYATTPPGGNDTLYPPTLAGASSGGAYSIVDPTLSYTPPGPAQGDPLIANPAREFATPARTQAPFALGGGPYQPSDPETFIGGGNNARPDPFALLPLPPQKRNGAGLDGLQSAPALNQRHDNQPNQATLEQLGQYDPVGALTGWLGNVTSLDPTDVTDAAAAGFAGVQDWVERPESATELALMVAGTSPARGGVSGAAGGGRIVGGRSRVIPDEFAPIEIPSRPLDSRVLETNASGGLGVQGSATRGRTYQGPRRTERPYSGPQHPDDPSLEVMPESFSPTYIPDPLPSGPLQGKPVVSAPARSQAPRSARPAIIEGGAANPARPPARMQQPPVLDPALAPKAPAPAEAIPLPMRTSQQPVMTPAGAPGKTVANGMVWERASGPVNMPKPPTEALPAGTTTASRMLPGTTPTVSTAPPTRQTTGRPVFGQQAGTVVQQGRPSLGAAGRNTPRSTRPPTTQAAPQVPTTPVSPPAPPAGVSGAASGGRRGITPKQAAAGIGLLAAGGALAGEAINNPPASANRDVSMGSKFGLDATPPQTPTLRDGFTSKFGEPRRAFAPPPGDQGQRFGGSLERARAEFRNPKGESGEPLPPAIDDQGLFTPEFVTILKDAGHIDAQGRWLQAAADAGRILAEDVGNVASYIHLARKIDAGGGGGAPITPFDPNADPNATVVDTSGSSNSDGSSSSGGNGGWIDYGSSGGGRSGNYTRRSGGGGRSYGGSRGGGGGGFSGGGFDGFDLDFARSVLGPDFMAGFMDDFSFGGVSERGMGKSGASSRRTKRGKRMKGKRGKSTLPMREDTPMRADILAAIEASMGRKL